MPDTAQGAFEAVVSAHHEEIYRYLRRLIWPSAEAEDLSQETFLHAYRAFARLPEGANIRAWLFTIASNLARNHFRSESRRRRAYGEVRAAGRGRADPPPEEALLSRETGAMIEALVRRLPFKQRLAFTQRKIHGLGYEAIAESLGCSAETARAHVFQALRKIRRGLDGHGSLPGEQEP